MRAAAEATSAADDADRARRNEALALAQLRANDRDATAARDVTRVPAVPPTQAGRWARAVRHPNTATRRVLGRVKRLLDR